MLTFETESARLTAQQTYERFLAEAAEAKMIKNLSAASPTRKWRAAIRMVQGAGALQRWITEGLMSNRPSGHNIDEMGRGVV